MSKTFFLTFFSCFFFSISKSQQRNPDSIYRLPAVQVKAYLNVQPFLQLTTSAGLVDSSLLEKQMGTTLLPAFNNVPGVRMEERSPGSYRLSIRGSLLRSPFGIRNVKVYYDDIPLTDAGGNTYLNSLDPSAVQQANILKGPDGSLFGANTGGVVLLQNLWQESNQGRFSVNSGSYGLLHQQLSTDLSPSEKYQFRIAQAYQRADGYRQNSALERKFLQTAQRYAYKAGHELRLNAFYSDIAYRTPGGLNPQQYLENPRLARQATATIPGSVEQQAGIYNKTLWGGLVHEAPLANELRHVLSVFGSYTDFTNPFITNYEKRFENNYGFRTYMAYENKRRENLSWNIYGGVEWQKGRYRILNYDNNGGAQGAEQAGDRLRNDTYFYFLRGQSTLFDKLILESSLSLNYNGYAYRSIFPIADDGEDYVRFSPAWMPRFAASYLLTPYVAWRASASKGYSPATTAEIRSSDNIINTDLGPETGWNYETGMRWLQPNGLLQLDASVFYYEMDNAIVRQLREGGEEFFVNAGNIKQWGVEGALQSVLYRNATATALQRVQLNTNIALSHFRFGQYSSGTDDFSKNRLTGVPITSIVSNISTDFSKGISVFIQHEYVSNIPLNDANSIYASPYNLLQAKVMWQNQWIKNSPLTLFAGVDNLLNETYSLGNDINAFGNRFFNASMPRNFYVGLNITPRF